jgi:sulfoxide reductase heme-binding subunit YedZ
MANTPIPWWQPTTRTGIHVLCALPLLVLLGRTGLTFLEIDPGEWAAHHLGVWATGIISDLGVNPIETIIRYLGDWALRFLIIALAVRPVSRLIHKPALMRYRRMLGLWAFAYVTFHMLNFIITDQFFDWASIGKQIVQNKFITVGMAAFVLLLPLAITSTRGMVMRLGAKRWQRLHRLAYFAGICGSVHYIWMVKADIRQPLVYFVILMILLGLRLFWWARARFARAAGPVPAPQPKGAG